MVLDMAILVEMYLQEKIGGNPMQSVTKKDVPEICGIFSDTFTLLLKYYNAPGKDSSREEKDAFWSGLISDSEIVVKRYNSKLCNDILVAITDNINERVR